MWTHFISFCEDNLKHFLASKQPQRECDFCIHSAWLNGNENSEINQYLHWSMCNRHVKTIENNFRIFFLSIKFISISNLHSIHDCAYFIELITLYKSPYFIGVQKGTQKSLNNSFFLFHLIPLDYFTDYELFFFCELFFLSYSFFFCLFTANRVSLMAWTSLLKEI